MTALLERAKPEKKVAFHTDLKPSIQAVGSQYQPKFDVNEHLLV